MSEENFQQSDGIPGESEYLRSTTHTWRYLQSKCSSVPKSSSGGGFVSVFLLVLGAFAVYMIYR